MASTVATLFTRLPVNHLDQRIRPAFRGGMDTGIVASIHGALDGPRFHRPLAKRLWAGGKCQTDDQTVENGRRS